MGVDEIWLPSLKWKCRTYFDVTASEKRQLPVQPLAKISPNNDISVSLDCLFKSVCRLTTKIYHDDVIKWRHFPRYWPFVRGNHRSPVNSPHKGRWRGALMFSLICVWINGWVNNREAGDLRRHRAHYDVIVIARLYCSHCWLVSGMKNTIKHIRLHVAGIQIGKTRMIFEYTVRNGCKWTPLLTHSGQNYVNTCNTHTHTHTHTYIWRFYYTLWIPCRRKHVTNLNFVVSFFKRPCSMVSKTVLKLHRKLGFPIAA